ncbi:MAG: hypothetical protein Q9P14_10560 [candidate division KSB1 bacterium]|nr:hypothetical protein [candidate division KSB1 bacterium]
MLYGVGLGLFVGVLWKALPYYRLDLIERPHSLAHPDFKPGGRIGHALGILGSAMLLLLFLYSARKRELFGLRWGNISRWLDIHIFFRHHGTAVHYPAHEPQVQWHRIH